MEVSETAIRAAQEYLARQSRRRDPAGKFDRGGRWYPSAAEERPCCAAIRPPSRRWPLSLLRHCRSDRHVAALFGVSVAELRAAIQYIAALEALA